MSYPFSTPPANAGEVGDLGPTAPARRRLVLRLDRMRADDRRRAAERRRRRDRAYRRGLVRVDHGGRGVAAQRRHAAGIADAARVGERPGIGGAIRHAADRRIAGAGGASGRKGLRKGLAREHQAAEHGQNKRCYPGHRTLRNFNDEVGCAFPQTRATIFTFQVRAAPAGNCLQILRFEETMSKKPNDDGTEERSPVVTTPKKQRGASRPYWYWQLGTGRRRFF